MSETPQTDPVESEVIDQPVETNDSAVESDTTSQVEGESNQQVDEAAVKQKKIDDAFNKQYGERKQAERERDVALAKVANFESSERERQAAAVGEIPPVPDALDDDFEEKMCIRDQAIKDQATHNANNTTYLKQQETQQQQTQLAQQQEQAKVLQGHNSRVKAQGIDASEMMTAENTVLTYGISPDLVRHIASMEDSPNIIRHLAANPQDGYSLVNADPYQAAASLASIRVKAEALKPKASETPAPAETLTGGGADPEAGKYPMLKGAKFE